MSIIQIPSAWAGRKVSVRALVGGKYRVVCITGRATTDFDCDSLASALAEAGRIAGEPASRR
jgi:hypothetical protein